MSSKIKEDFIEDKLNFLNSTLTSNLLRENKRYIDIKNKFLIELKNDISKEIEKRIDKNYSKYLEFLLAEILKNINGRDKSSEIEIELNFKDYEYFHKNPEKIKKDLKNLVSICKSSDNFIGGFRILLFKKRMIYDFTIENLISENLTIIEDTILDSLSDSKIKEIENNFESFILNQKEKLKEYFK